MAVLDGLLAVLPLDAAGRQSFFYLVCGSVLGVGVGLLPGLGSAAALALLLPFVFTLEPTAALALLLGMSAVTATAGDVTSVLFGVPGEGTAAATVVDGYALTRRGEAGRALGAVLMASLIGAVFGALLLALCVPLVRPLVLAFAAPELFMLTVLALTLVAALSGGQLLRGLVTGTFGLLLALVGLDPLTGTPRLVMEPLLGADGALFLWDGVSLIAVTLGLFTLPELLALATQGNRAAVVELSGAGVRQGLREAWQQRGLVLRCSAGGALIGLLPGLGGSVAQWVAYAQAAQSVTDKSQLGRGAIEGVLGPAAANNAKDGGALLPTLAFGVPGSVTTAVLLGAFTLLGLVPGPAMLDPQQQLPLTFSLVWIIVLANTLAVALCLLLLGRLTAIVRLPGALLVPWLVCLVYVGALAIKHSGGDVLLVLLGGGLGWWMVRRDWPRAPLLLGLVLGGLAEKNLFIANAAYGTDWLGRPLVLGLALLLLVVLGRAWWRYRRTAAGLAPALPGSWPDLFWLVVFVAVAVVTLGQLDTAGRAAWFPLGASLLGALLLLVVLVRNGYRWQPDRRLSFTERREGFALLGLAVLFGGIELIGFLPATGLLTLLYLRIQSREQRSGIGLVLSGAAPLVCYGVFAYGLGLPLPTGLLWPG